MENRQFSVDYSEIDRVVSGLFPEDEGMSFSGIMNGFMDGEIPLNEVFTLLRKSGTNGLFYGFIGMREVLFIAVVAAVFYILSQVGKQGQAAQTGFFVAYLLIVAGMFRIYETSREIVAGTLDCIMDFMKVLLPVYCTGITIASGGIGASLFYQVAMWGIAAVSVILKNVILPIVGLYFMLSVLNRILEEDFLSKLAALLYSAAEGLMKISVAAILGIGAVQGMIGPATDAVKRSAVLKTVGSIPVVGDMLDSTAQTVLAAGILLKNTIGAAGAFILFLICMTPLLRIGIANISIKFGAALLQPVSDKRITDCLGYAAKAHKLLIRMIMYTMLMFILMILFMLMLTGSRGGV